MQTKNILLILVVLCIILVSGCTQKANDLTENETISAPEKTEVTEPTTQEEEEEPTTQEEKETEDYDPIINPDDFVSNVNNKYFTLTPKKKFIYESETEEGTERIEVYVTNETKEVMGVAAIVVWDRVWLDGYLIEDTKDWYAQDKEGNVWYFGEESKELIDGKVVTYAGSWESGVDGAKPGIIMKANPKVGESYRQEYYEGEAEDMGEVLALGEAVEVPYKSFTNCLKTRDWNPLEPEDDEYKYYCPEVGGVVLEVALEDGERVELIDVKIDTEEKQAEQTPTEKPEVLKTDITEEEAIAIALSKVKGTVTDVDIEGKFGKATYVVEVFADTGVETDVIIDIETGEVLGIET